MKLRIGNIDADWTPGDIYEIWEVTQRFVGYSRLGTITKTPNGTWEFRSDSKNMKPMALDRTKLQRIAKLMKRIEEEDEQ